MDSIYLHILQYTQIRIVLKIENKPIYTHTITEYIHIKVSQCIPGDVKK